MKLLLLPFAIVAAFDVTMFVLARIGRCLAPERVTKKVLSRERRNALRPRDAGPEPLTGVSRGAKQSRALPPPAGREPKRSVLSPTLIETQS